LRPISRVYGKGGVPIKSGVEPDQEDYIQDKPADHGDHVVAGRAGLGKRDVAARLPALQRHAVEHSVSEKRAEKG